MNRARAVAVFFGTLVLVYAVLIAPWPGLLEGYASVYRATAESAFRMMLGSRVSFLENRESDGKDVRIRLRISADSKAVANVPHDTRLTGYLSFAETMAFILATPLAWKRRLVAAAWGALLIHLFVGLRLAAILWFMANSQSAGFWNSLSNRVHEFMAVSPTPTFVAPVLVWVGVMIRRPEVQSLMQVISRAGHPRPS